MGDPARCEPIPSDVGRAVHADNYELAMNTSELLVLDQRYCAQGDTSARRNPKKLFLAADGHFIFDENDIPHLDFQTCNSAANLGYRTPDHLEAIARQGNRLPALASEFMHRDRVLLAKAICDSVENAFGVRGRVHFTVGGAQAVDDALKIVAAVTGSRKVFAFQGGYHGRTIAASEVSASYRYRSVFRGSANAVFVPFPYCFRCPFEKEPESCGLACARQFEQVVENDAAGIRGANGELECRAFLAEPVQGRGGYIPAPASYFQRIEPVLRRNQILLVADEVQMGFFRAGRQWSIQNFGVCPDLIIFGKSLTNGMHPLAGVWAREPLLDSSTWPPGSSHSTYGAAPLGTALGLATFEAYARRDYEVVVEESGRAVEAACRRLEAQYPCIGHVNRLGLALSLDICAPDGRTPDEALARAIVEAGLSEPVTIDGRAYGLVLTRGGHHDNMVMIAPPIDVTAAEIVLFERLLGKTLERVCRPAEGGA